MNSVYNIPVVVFAYNRPTHIKKALDALNNSVNANLFDLYIFCDGNKGNNDKEAVKLVQNEIEAFIENSNFNKTITEFSVENKGLANSIITGVTRIINIYDVVIVIEDDLIVSNLFLEYMKNALMFYQNNCKIWSISGYSFPMKSLENYKHDVFITGRGCSWGWATWKDRWNLVDWNVSDYERFIKNKRQIKEFSKSGADLPNMLELQMNGRIDSWAIRWCYSEYKNNMYTIYPKESLIVNKGLDGSGTHSEITTDYDTELSNSKDIVFENVKLNKKILKEFRKKYSPPTFQLLKERIKQNYIGSIIVYIYKKMKSYVRK